MDRRDQELLAKQLQGITPPRNDGIINLTIVAVFFAGLALGAMLFAHHDERMRAAPGDAMAAISLPNGAPPTMQQ